MKKQKQERRQIIRRRPFVVCHCFSSGLFDRKPVCGLATAWTIRRRHCCGLAKAGLSAGGPVAD
jgi:hypothetical protein